jgi:hypothetical protein
MKTKKTELEVDFIGDNEGLTNSEEKALSEFFKQRKLVGKPIKTTLKLRSQSNPKANDLRP